MKEDYVILNYIVGVIEPIVNSIRNNQVALERFVYNLLFLSIKMAAKLKMDKGKFKEIIDSAWEAEEYKNVN